MDYYGCRFPSSNDIDQRHWAHAHFPHAHYEVGRGTTFHPRYPRRGAMLRPFRHPMGRFSRGNFPGLNEPPFPIPRNFPRQENSAAFLPCPRNLEYFQQGKAVEPMFQDSFQHQNFVATNDSKIKSDEFWEEKPLWISEDKRNVTPHEKPCTDIKKSGDETVDCDEQPELIDLDEKCDFSLVQNVFATSGDKELVTSSDPQSSVKETGQNSSRSENDTLKYFTENVMQFPESNILEENPSESNDNGNNLTNKISDNVQSIPFSAGDEIPAYCDNTSTQNGSSNLENKSTQCFEKTLLTSDISKQDIRDSEDASRNDASSTISSLNDSDQKVIFLAPVINITHPNQISAEGEDGIFDASNLALNCFKSEIFKDKLSEYIAKELQNYPINVASEDSKLPLSDNKNSDATLVVEGHENTLSNESGEISQTQSEIPEFPYSSILDFESFENQYETSLSSITNYDLEDPFGKSMDLLEDIFDSTSDKSVVDSGMDNYILDNNKSRDQNFERQDAEVQTDICTWKMSDACTQFDKDFCNPSGRFLRSTGKVTTWSGNCSSVTETVLNKCEIKSVSEEGSKNHDSMKRKRGTRARDNELNALIDKSGDIGQVTETTDDLKIHYCTRRRKEQVSTTEMTQPLLEKKYRLKKGKIKSESR